MTRIRIIINDLAQKLTSDGAGTGLEWNGPRLLLCGMWMWMDVLCAEVEVHVDVDVDAATKWAAR